MRISAFRALRPPAELAAQVAAPPYDVLDVAEAKALAQPGNASFLHITRPEVDLPADLASDSDQAYAKAQENFRRFREEGRLVREEQSCVYVYRQRMADHVQHGVVVRCHIEDYERDVIRRHERTKPQHENDRARLIAALRAHTGPVFMTYKPEPGLDRAVAGVEAGAPLFDFVAPDGIAHTVWRVPGGEPFVSAFDRVAACYIADGHHRAAGAVRVGRAERAANPAHTGHEPYNWFLAALFPADQLLILPYNRCVSSLNGLTKAGFLDRLAEHVAVAADGPGAPREPGRVGMYLGGVWYELSLPLADGAALDPLAALDVSVLQARVLDPILGIADPTRDPRIDFVGGIRGPAELVRRVDSGRAAVAFALYPTRIDQLLAVADAGRNMPPKSTWFEPKLRSGLLVHTLDEG
ncbi:MAG: DUF1015 domain-containing protein [Kiritimatiellae bacterium]|nr:DUF1015 domain-containing protein [Kiritimatiellia bacterium]